MVLLESTLNNLNEKLPSFTLKDPSGASYGLSDLIGEKGLLVAFTCNHCPYAIAVWDRLIHLSTDLEPLGINTVAINPNINPNYPEDSPENMSKFVEKVNLPFPYLVDETQSVAKKWSAVCTPDFFLIDARQTLYYRGRLDDNWQDATAVSTQDLKEAAHLLSQSQTAPNPQYPSMGCSIKWMN